MVKVFISRYLASDSTFHKRLTISNFEVTGQSLIDFSAIPFEAKIKADWLFFYSKNGVRFFFENISPNDFTEVKIAAIGPATAEALSDFHRSVDFIGDGNPESTSTSFLEVAAGMRVLFPQALNSRQSIQKILKEKVTALDLVVYQNSPKKKVPLSDFEVLVFTSPLNAQAYFSIKKHVEGQRVIAIGEATAGALKELGIPKIELATEASEKALAEKVLTG